jgi:hypothetical protein
VNLKIGQLVMLIPNRFSSMRTKNKVLEHGDIFEVLRFDPNSALFDLRPAIFVRSERKNVKDGQGSRVEWIGWFPTDEVEIKGE